MSGVIVRVKIGVSNLLMCFLVVKIEHMLGACLAGREKEVGNRPGAIKERGSIPLVK
jgi:hypothetical protein